MVWREERTVTLNLTLHYDRMMLLLDPTPFARGLVRKKVDVVNYPDGRFAVQFEGMPLSFRVFDKIQTVQPGTIVENKRLGAALALVKEQQGRLPATSVPPPSRPATTTKQSGGAGNADKEPAVAPGGRRGVGRTAGAGTRLTARSIPLYSVT